MRENFKTSFSFSPKGLGFAPKYRQRRERPKRGILWENFRSSGREVYIGTPSPENGNRKGFTIETEEKRSFSTLIPYQTRTSLKTRHYYNKSSILFGLTKRSFSDLPKDPSQCFLREEVLRENFRSSRREVYIGTPSPENGNRKGYTIETEENLWFSTLVPYQTRTLLKTRHNSII